MSAISAAVAATLRGDPVGLAYGVRMDFTSGTMSVWPGQGAIDGSPFGAPVFSGIGRMGQVGSVELGAVAATQSLTLSLSGLDPGLRQIAHNQRTEVSGRRVALYLIVFDPRTAALLDVRLRRTLVMDKITTRVTGDGSPPTMTCALSAEPILAAKNHAPFSYLTDADQRGRFPDDKALERTQEMSQNQTLVWGS